MAELAALNSLDNYVAPDILQDEGGLLRQRGKVLYASDFSDGLDGWIPVFNRSGTESIRPPLSLLNYPLSGIRVAAPGTLMQQGTRLTPSSD